MPWNILLTKATGPSVETLLLRADEASLMQELQRVFDICHGCRRCFSLCNAFPTLFDFGKTGGVPEVFKPTCHLFYGARVVDVSDDLPKWSGHKNHSDRL